jgi:hypothetical protein
VGRGGRKERGDEEVGMMKYFICMNENRIMKNINNYKKRGPGMIRK